MASERRAIVIGDVHGCLDELQDLLRAAGAGPDDRLISVGDLVCKGPDGLGVLDWAMTTPNVEVVLGNHERRLLKHWRRGTLSEEKTYDADVYRQLGSRYDECMRFVARWPLTVSGPGFAVVHAGLDPEKPLERQSEADLTNLRRLPGTGRPWYESYRDERLIVFGHWARRRPVVRRNAVGLDTGCVYGAALTAVILPERRFVSVPARRAYRRKEKWDDELAEAA
ncbi:MAG: metallophosphoesterase [Elusimicrobia bacterium]|nr:metallophosphoesterase [Elusimicrobiota bacterium]